MSDALPPVTRADLDNARRALVLNHSSVHLVPPPRITTQEANAAHVAALEAVLDAMLDHLPDCHRVTGYYALENDCSCGLYARRQVINALFREAG